VTERRPKAETIHELLAHRLTSVRKDVGLRQEDVANRAQDLGLQWARATVAQLETGRRELAVDEYLALPAIYGCTLEEFLGSGQRLVQLLPGLTVSRSELTRPTVGRRSSLRAASVGGPTPSGTARASVSSGLVSDSEMKAARKIFGGPHAATRLTDEAQRLWGRSLVAEREARVAEIASTDTSGRTLQALRGHVTRGLLADLEQAAIKKRDARRQGRRGR
jgi:transcriptional regulator with XRE-family HTH domain